MRAEKRKRKTKAELEVELEAALGLGRELQYEVMNLKRDLKASREKQEEFETAWLNARKRAEIAEAVYRCKIVSARCDGPAEECDFVLLGYRPREEE